MCTDVRSVQTQLGRKNIDTAMQYLQLTRPALDARYGSTSPRIRNPRKAPKPVANHILTQYLDATVQLSDGPLLSMASAIGNSVTAEFNG